MECLRLKTEGSNNIWEENSSLHLLKDRDCFPWLQSAVKKISMRNIQISIFILLDQKSSCILFIWQSPHALTGYLFGWFKYIFWKNNHRSIIYYFSQVLFFTDQTSFPSQLSKSGSFIYWISATAIGWILTSLVTWRYAVSAFSVPSEVAQF